MKASYPAFVGDVLKLVALAAWWSGFLVPSNIRAEEWSAEQKEVWKNVETYWALDAAGDTPGFLAYFHPDYKGWNYNSPIPGSKERATKFATHNHKTSKTLVYDLQPVTVRVYGEMAYVHYFWTRIGKEADGKEKRESGRWTDILKKQGRQMGDGGRPRWGNHTEGMTDTTLPILKILQSPARHGPNFVPRRSALW